MIGEEVKQEIISPQAGFQERFVRSNVDVVIGGGVLNCGKSFAAILCTAEPSLDPNFRACFLRRTFTELNSGGGLTDDFAVAFGKYVDIRTTNPPRVRYPSGSFVDFRQINDENPKKVKEVWKGAQYDLIYMDELTSFEFSTFKYLLTRNRGKGKWTGKFRGTTNPERDCWIRIFIDWYIAPDGTIAPDRDGVVRYFYLGESDKVEDVIWGNTKDEVYAKAKADIDRKLKSLGEGFSPYNLIKSFTFYLGKMSENKASIGNNMDYAGSVAAVGGKTAQQLIEGNWNVSTKDEDSPITFHMAESIFDNDARINNDLWITADLADTGEDNTIILAWNGLHVFDIDILCTSTPLTNVQRIRLMAERHGIPDTHIIYDGVRAVYVADYMPEARPFISYRKSKGLYWRLYYNLKDECYARVVEFVKRGLISFDEKIANSFYPHKRIHTPILIKQEIIDEMCVINFKELPGGRRTLINKKEMNRKLGKHRSMDMCDPIAMRAEPLLEYQYGLELILTAKTDMKSENLEEVGVDVYDETIWA